MWLGSCGTSFHLGSKLRFGKGTNTLVVNEIVIVFLKTNVVSKSPSETMMCLQTFIVKTLLIKNMNGHHIYIQMERRVREQDAG
jgi:hypothetical protein